MTKKVILISLAILTIASSCKKKGCIDKLANNYNSEAKKDDGSCTYDGSVVFWINGTTAYNLRVIDSVDFVSIYVDNSKVGQMTTNSNYIVSPACNEGGVTFHYDLGALKEKTFTYEAKFNYNYEPANTTEHTLSSSSFTVKGGLYTPYEIQ